jgi:predicted DsbA family dithiol-disulfide isomerase
MSIKIDVVSDVACPWCYVGMKRLEKALAVLPEIKVEVNWHPFQLDPNIPLEGVELQAYFIKKFGSRDKVNQIFDHMQSVGEAEDISFDFHKMHRTMNSLALHVLMQQAEIEGFKTILKNRFFKAYFEEALDLSNQQILIDIMTEFGWETDKTQDILKNNDLYDTVKDKIKYDQSRGVSAVPFFIFNDQYGISGAQPPQVLVDTLLQLDQELKIKASNGEACDIESGEC